MKYYQYIFYSLFITLLCAENQTAEDILLQACHRMDGIDHQFKVESKRSCKKKKQKHFQVSIHWHSEGTFLRQTRIISIETKQKKPSSFWEHRFRDGTKAKKWMSLPITGKLKDVSNKKPNKKDFSLSEMILNEGDIRSQTHQLLPQKNFNKFSAYVIESMEKDKKGNIKKSKKWWIDIDSYVILKIEFYTGSGRLYRNIECSNFQYIEKIFFPMSIYIEDLKSKTDTQINITDIELYPEFDLSIFIPRHQ